jgi:hypothetical protein
VTVTSVIICESCLAFYGAKISGFSVLFHHCFVCSKMVVW